MRTHGIALLPGERHTVHTAAGKVEIRLKGDWHPLHVWLPVGVWLLSLVWSSFDLDRWREDYATSARGPRIIYVGTERGGISPRLLDHEVRHFLQALREAFYALRYAFPRFRLRMEAEAYISSGTSPEATVETLTAGEYGPLGRDVVEREVDRARHRYGWEA